MPDQGYQGAVTVPSQGPGKPLLRRQEEGQARVRVPWEVAKARVTAAAQAAVLSLVTLSSGVDLGVVLELLFTLE